MTSERRFDIDWLRVIAIGLLLIYHIAIIFQPWALFIGFIRSNDAMETLWQPMTMLNVWRIPLLFYVSGMGVCFAIRNRDWKALLLERSKRILLPFLFGIIAIVPLQFFVFQAYYQQPLDYYAHPAHLWFLGNIFVYVLLLLPLFYYLKKSREGRFARRFSKLMSHPAGPLALSVFFVLEALLVNPAAFELYALTWHGFYLGLLAFFFGFLFVYSGKTFWPTILKWRWLYLGLALTMYIVRYMAFGLKSPNFLMAIESNAWILAIFGFGYKYLNKPSTVLSYLSQAAYPVYIIHMFALFTAASVILPLEIPVLLKFIATVALTGAICFIVYEYVIRRIHFLKPLFGLKWSPRKRKIDVSKAHATTG